MKILSIFIFLIFALSCQQNNEINIAYQGMANPWKYLIKNKAFKDLTKKEIHWKKFNSGAKIINAMASGDVDLAVMGSTPLASALGKGLPLKLIWTMEIIGDSEALVARKEIKEVKDLVGKKVAVPFGSTTHYHLLLALKKAGVDPAQIEIFNLTPASIVASWNNKQIDAAYVWAPALEEIKKDGHVLLSSLQLAKAGDPTFDAIVAREDFLKENKDFTVGLLEKINSLHQEINQNSWSEKDDKIQDIASFVGAKPADVVNSLKGYQFPTLKEQLSEALLGGGLATALKKTSLFLKEQEKISEVKESYSSFIDSHYAQEIE